MKTQKKQQPAKSNLTYIVNSQTALEVGEMLGSGVDATFYDSKGKRIEPLTDSERIQLSQYLN